MIPSHDLSEVTRTLKNIKTRYPNLYIPTDYLSMESTWIRTVRPKGSTPRPLFVTNEAVDFEVTNVKDDPKDKEKEKEKVEVDAATPAPVVAEPGVSPSGKRYSVRVALLNAIPAEDLVNTYVPHLARQLKFLVQEKEGKSRS